jgi:trigger factor
VRKREGGYNSVVKSEFADLSETKKSVAVEIPSGIVDAEINRVARSYSRQARIPGFRQGKVPPTLIKKRFREQILHDVAQRSDPARHRRGAPRARLEPSIRRREGRVARRRAGADVHRHVRDAPAIDPGPLDTISLRRPAVTLEENAVEQTLSQLQNRAARYEPSKGAASRTATR